MYIDMLDTEQKEGRWMREYCNRNRKWPKHSHLKKFINPLQNNKILDVTKLKAFADNKLNMTKTMISLFERVENSVGKGENAGYQHFLLFP